MDDKNIDVKEKVNFIVAKFTICFNILQLYPMTPMEPPLFFFRRPTHDYLAISFCRPLIIIFGGRHKKLIKLF